MKLKLENKAIENIVVDINGQEVAIRPYLTVGEMQLICRYIHNLTDIIEQEIFVDKAVIQYCTDIENIEELDAESPEWGGVVKTITSNISNYNTLIEHISKSRTIEFSVERLVTNVTTAINEFVDRFTNLDISKTLEDIKKADDVLVGGGDVSKAILGVLPKIVENSTPKDK